MSATLINEAPLLKMLQAQLQVEIEKAAEPFVQQALRDAEREVRAKVRAWAVTYLEHTMDLRMGGDRLTITINAGGIVPR